MSVPPHVRLARRNSDASVWCAAGKPKKLTGYQLFANQQRQELKASRPDARSSILAAPHPHTAAAMFQLARLTLQCWWACISFGEVSQQIGTMWNGMNVAEKTVYTGQATPFQLHVHPVVSHVHGQTW